MTDDPVLHLLRRDLECELTENILPYWLAAVDETHGGFVGLITTDEVAHADAPKGAVLVARILWTFAAAYRALGRDAYLVAAERALDSLRTHLLDLVHGGVYWMVEADGAPNDSRKHVYAQAFAIYALSEHARATGDRESLRLAVDLFRLVERHAHDATHGGYSEAFTRDWAPLADARLSDVDADERKSMNTHLHLVEAYANLLRVWPDPLVRRRLTELLEIFIAHVVDADAGHLRLFFDDDWTPRGSTVSYGHDIEASWLLLDAADALGDSALRARLAPLCLRVAETVRREALDDVGGIFNERRADGTVDTDKDWWPQAEAIVGFLCAYRESGRAELRDAGAGTWAFVRRHVCDARHGEWLRRVSRDGVPRPGHEKAGPWKCPYHDARACLEIMARVAAEREAVDAVRRLA